MAESEEDLKSGPKKKLFNIDCIAERLSTKKQVSISLNF